MAELTDLLHAAAAGHDVPPAPLTRIRADGRRLRTRRRVRTAAAGAVAAVAVAAGLALSTGDAPRADERRTDPVGQPTRAPSAASAYQRLGTYALGGVVHVGDATWDAGGPVRHLAQTSRGVVVVHGAAGPPSFTLVRPDGSTRSLALPAEVGIVSGDPSAPRIAWTSLDGEEVTMHVWSIDDDRELFTATERVPGARPPGDILLPHLDGETAAVAVPVGPTIRLSLLWTWRDPDALARVREGEVTSVHEGRGLVLGQDDRWSVRELATDRVLRELGGVPIGEPILAPDGRHVLYPSGDGDLVVVDVATGGEQILDGEFAGTWTPGSRITTLSSTEPEISSCTPSGECEAVAADIEATPGSLILGDQLMLG